MVHQKSGGGSHHWTARPTFIVAVIFVVVLVVALLFWKAGTPTNSVDPTLAKRLDGTAAARAATDQRKQELADNAARAQINPPKGRELRVAYLGDWITQGAFATSEDKAYPNRVDAWLRGQIPVHSQILGVRGGTPAMALASRIPGNQDLIIVDFGTDQTYTPQRSAFNSSYSQLIRQLHRTSPRAQVMCVTPWVPNGSAEDYDKIIHRVCSHKGNETVVDLGSVSIDQASQALRGQPYRGATKVPYDGRPNDKGHEAIARAIEMQVQIVP